MSNIQNSLKTDDAIFKALDLKTINRLICTTDKGVLSLQIRKGETNYHLCLDSVPLSKELNRTLMDLLFPIPKMEVPQVNKSPFEPIEVNKEPLSKGVKSVAFPNILDNPIKKRLGRPKGAKTGVKMD